MTMRHVCVRLLSRDKQSKPAASEILWPARLGRNEPPMTAIGAIL
jgi:hypothetical protein